MITDRQAKNVVLQRQIKVWGYRECSICGYSIGYRFKAEEVTFDPNCGCTRYWSPTRSMTYEQFVNETFNMQSDPAVRDNMWQKFTKLGEEPKQARGYDRPRAEHLVVELLADNAHQPSTVLAKIVLDGLAAENLDYDAGYRSGCAQATGDT